MTRLERGRHRCLLLQDAGYSTPRLFSTPATIPELENALLVGLQVAQLPVCTMSQSMSPITDPFDGTSATLAMPYATSGREFKLMAHLSGSASTSGGLSIEVLEEEDHRAGWLHRRLGDGGYTRMIGAPMMAIS